MRGLLLLNTGSPKSPKRSDVRAFIEAMLMDPLVLPLSKRKRTILVKWIIGPFRQFSSAKKYRMIWSKQTNKSALLDNMDQLAEALRQELQIPVEVGMRYLEPSIDEALDKLKQYPDLTELTVLPLFPHYADSSYLTTVEEFKRIYAQKELNWNISICDPYFNNESYINALVDSIQKYSQIQDAQFLFNYHSLPIAAVTAGRKKGAEFDYVYQAKETIKLVRQKLGLSPTNTKIVFSSAIGKNWIGPFLVDKLKDMAENGVETVFVISPGFASDNLETLYDITIEARKEFLNNGGKKFIYIPCLNYNPVWVKAIAEIIK